MFPPHRMHLRRAVLITLLAVAGCGVNKHYVPPEAPMPPNTVLLSQMMRELSARPGFTEAMLSQLDKGGQKKGPALLTPTLIDNLRQRILGKDWEGLDRFPGWTMSKINPTVRTLGHFIGKSDTAEDLSAVHPGASPSTAQTRDHLDLGPYSLTKAETVSLDRPSTLPGFTSNGIVSSLGAGVTRGDGPSPISSEHAESQRLADVLNRLAANGLEGTETFRVNRLAGVAPLRDPNTPPTVYKLVAHFTKPEDLIWNLIHTGHTVTVQDARYFANFGHFHYNGAEVMMPFWVNSQIVVPNSGGRALLVPVSHAEYEWHIRGPLLNADVSYYFGIDGKSQWRTMDTLDQAWVLKRNAHTYTGKDAIEVTRLTGLLTVAYMHLHATHPTLPFGGYYALGVCQDGVSAIEKHMTGHVTLFPNTADSSLFNDPRDAEINALITSIPKDRAGKPPEPERIFGSLPTDPGVNNDFATITIPGLAEDLAAVHKAWTNGTLRRTHSRLNILLLIAGLAVIAAAGISAARRRKKH